MKRILSFLTVAALLSGVSFAQAADEAAPVATEEAPKDSAAAVKNESETSKKFKARASVEGDAWFAATIDGNTTNEGMDAENNYSNNGFNRASLNAKIRLKINMDLLPKFTSYIEVLILNNEKKRGNIFDRHGIDDAGGIRDLFLYGILAKPIDHWGQGKTDKNEIIMLDQAKIGIDTEWFDWETGFLNSKIPAHKVGYWDTVKDIKANADKVNGGYGWFGMQKDSKKGLKEVGPMGLNLAASFSHMSNNISHLNKENNAFEKSKEGFGNIIDMFGFVDLGFVEDVGAEKAEDKYNHRVGLQFDSALSYANGGTYMPSADVILGYNGKFPMGIYGGVNMLFNVHDTEPTKDLSALHDLALAAKLGWKWEFVDKLEFGVKMRGNNTNLIFLEKPGDVLGAQNSLKFEVNDNFKVHEGIKLGVDGDVAFTLDKDAVGKKAKIGAGNKNKDNVKYGFKPHLDIDLNDLANMNGALSFYTKLEGVSEDDDEFKRGSDSSKFICKDVVLKFSSGSDKKPLNDTVNYYNVYLNWHNASEFSDEVKEVLKTRNKGEEPFSFFTLSGDIRLKSKMTLNGGIGARIPNKDVKGDSSEASPVGVFLGFDYKFDDKTIGGPTLFVRTQVGMKGYKELGDGIKVDRDKDSYVIKGGSYLTNWDLSTGIKWTF